VDSDFGLLNSRYGVDPVETVPEIERRDLVGGLIHEYHAVAA